MNSKEEKFISHPLSFYYVCLFSNGSSVLAQMQAFKTQNNFRNQIASHARLPQTISQTVKMERFITLPNRM